MDTLRRWGRDDLTTSGALLVTELVTNAILHARTMVRVILERGADFVRVEVRDGSPVRPALRNHGLDATTGRGLALVSQLADSWGVDVDGTGKVVWAQLVEDWDGESEHLYAVPDLGDDKADEAESGSSDETREQSGEAREQSGEAREQSGEARAAWSQMLGRCA